MNGKTNQDSTTRHPFKPNLTWSITKDWLRRQNVERSYVQSTKGLITITLGRIKDVVGALGWTFSKDGIKSSYSQYIHYANGNAYCDRPDQDDRCPHPNRSCNGCGFHFVEEPYKPTRLGFLKEELLGTYQMLLKVIGCFIHGHDLCGCGHAGPESGSMDHECKRCGEYWSVPLY